MGVPLPPLGSTCRYTFTTRFSTLDGVYTLTQLQTFDGALADGVNLAQDLYAKVGLTDTDYAQDWQSYQADAVLQLTSPTDASVVLYVPHAILDLIPDRTVRPVQNLFLAIDIGTLADPADLGWLIEQLQDQVSAVTGTTDTVKLYADKDTPVVWMTEAEYQAYETDRKSRIQAVAPVSVALRETQAALAHARALIEQYEATLIALQAP